MDIESKLTKIKGKDYLEVKWRILWFREDRPKGGIITEAVTVTDSMAVIKATVVDEDGKIIGCGHGWASVEMATMGRYVEKAETAAIGRALGVAGYGTQFAGEEFEEGDHLADSPVERAPKDKPAPKANPRPSASLATVKKMLADHQKNTADQPDAGEVMDTQARQTLAIKMGEVFRADDERHAFMAAVLGKASITELTKAEGRALYSWASNPNARKQVDDILA